MKQGLESQLIADITALKIVVQQLAGSISLLAGPNNNFLEAMRLGAHEALKKHQVSAPGIPEGEISARAEYTIDQIFDSLVVRQGSGSDDDKR